MRNRHLVKICTVAAVIALAASGCASKGATKAAETTAAETAAAETTAADVTQDTTQEAQTQADQKADAVKSEANTTAETAKKSDSKEIFEDFKAQDLDGKPVTQAIFADHDLTLINVWATFCGPCLSEMPELGELSTEYKDKGLQIVGVVADVLGGPDQVSPSQLDQAKTIVKKTKASYLHIVPIGDLSTTLLPQVPAVPTTIFVDKNGKQVGSAIVGARSKSDWKKLIDQNLKAVSTK